MSVPFAAIRGSLDQQISAKGVNFVGTIIDMYNERFPTSALIPSYIRNYADPRSATNALLDHFAGGRQHLLWQLYEVLSDLKIFPSTASATRYEQCEGYGKRPLQSSALPVNRARVLNFVDIRQDITDTLVSGYPSRLNDVINDWNAKLYSPTLLSSSSWGYTPELGVSCFLNYILGLGPNAVGQLYRVMKDLYFILPYPGSWEAMAEWNIRSNSLPVSVPLPVPSGPASLSLQQSDTVTENDALSCKICMANQIKVAAACGHTFCYACARQLQSEACPNCKHTPMQPFVRIYM